MDPCIVKYSVKIPTRRNFVIEFIIPKFFYRLNMFPAAHHSSSGALNCICSLWFICPYGDRSLPRLSGHGLRHASFLNRARNSRCTVITDLDTSKPEHTESLFLLRRHFGNWPRGPVVSMTSELLVTHDTLGQLPLLAVYVVPV